MKIEVNVEKKWVFLVVGIVFALAIGGYVYASSYVNPATGVGHDVNDLNWNQIVNHTISIGSRIFIGLGGIEGPGWSLVHFKNGTSVAGGIIRASQGSSDAGDAPLRLEASRVNVNSDICTDSGSCLSNAGGSRLVPLCINNPQQCAASVGLNVLPAYLNNGYNAGGYILGGTMSGGWGAPVNYDYAQGRKNAQQACSSRGYTLKGFNATLVYIYGSYNSNGCYPYSGSGSYAACVFTNSGYESPNPLWSVYQLGMYTTNVLVLNTIVCTDDQDSIKNIPLLT